MKSWKSWAGFVGIIIFVGMALLTAPYWIKFPNDNTSRTSLIVAIVTLIVTILILVVYVFPSSSPCSDKKISSALG